MNQNGNVVNFGYRSRDGIKHFEDTELLQVSTVEYMSEVAVNGEYGERFIAYLQSLSYDELCSCLEQTRQLYILEDPLEVLSNSALRGSILIDEGGKNIDIYTLKMNFFYTFFGIKNQNKYGELVEFRGTKIIVSPKSTEIAAAMIKFIELSIEQALVKYNGVPSNVIDIREKLNQKALGVLNDEPIHA